MRRGEIVTVYSRSVNQEYDQAIINSEIRRTSVGEDELVSSDWQEYLLYA